MARGAIASKFGRIFIKYVLCDFEVIAPVTEIV
jgi:hypothetical protein